MTTGQSIRYYRLASQMTQPELSRRCGIPQAGLCRIEQDRRDLTVGSLRRIAAALNIPPDRLLAPLPAVGPTANQEERLDLTREQLEALAAQVVGKSGGVSKNTWVGPWRLVTGRGPKNASDQAVFRAWNRIKADWPAETIRSMVQRIRDAASRVPA